MPLADPGKTTNKPQAFAGRLCFRLAFGRHLTCRPKRHGYSFGLAFFRRIAMSRAAIGRNCLAGQNRFTVCINHARKAWLSPSYSKVGRPFSRVHRLAWLKSKRPFANLGSKKVFVQIFLENASAVIAGCTSIWLGRKGRKKFQNIPQQNAWSYFHPVVIPTQY